MNKLDKFGKLISEDLRDSSLNRYLDIESGWSGSEKSKAMTAELSQFSERQQVFIRSLITECIDCGIHDFLFALERQKDGVSVLVDGDDICELSDGLQGEIFSEDGWFEKYSQHEEKGI